MDVVQCVDSENVSKTVDAGGSVGVRRSGPGRPELDREAELEVDLVPTLRTSVVVDADE